MSYVALGAVSGDLIEDALSGVANLFRMTKIGAGYGGSVEALHLLYKSGAKGQDVDWDKFGRRYAADVATTWEWGATILGIASIPLLPVGGAGVVTGVAASMMGAGAPILRAAARGEDPSAADVQQAFSAATKAGGPAAGLKPEQVDALARVANDPNARKLVEEAAKAAPKPPAPAKKSLPTKVKGRDKKTPKETGRIRTTRIVGGDSDWLIYAAGALAAAGGLWYAFRRRRRA